MAGEPGGMSAGMKKPRDAVTADTERRLNMIEAINEALDIMLARDPDVIVMGEDVVYFGGVFRCTAGLQEKHGKTRVYDTPISECGIIGVALRSEEHTSELQSLMRTSYAVFGL